MKKSVWLGAMGLIAAMWSSTAANAQECCGDCNNDMMVAINELVTCVNIALDTSPLAQCPACDCDDSGGVEINDLVGAVNRALEGCGDGETPTCGNDLVEAPETCDDGNIFGGDGCAGNCTSEDERVGTFDPARTVAFVQAEGFPIGPLNLTGSQIFRTGKIRSDVTMGPSGPLYRPNEMPVAIRAEDLVFDPIPVLGVVCACVRGVPVDDLFGPGISGMGVVGCNAEGLTDISYRLIQDHNTDPGSPNNENMGTPDDAECDDQTTLPGGTIARACREQVGADCLDATEHPHNGVCNGPRTLTRSGGAAGEGSAFILNNTAIGQLRDNGTCAETRRPDGSCMFADYGPDCLPCTEDDTRKGMANNVPTTTGSAGAAMFDANDAGSVIDQGEMCGTQPCQNTVVTGAPFDCDALQNDPTGGLSGGSLAVAFPALDAETIGDNVTSTVFFNQ